MKRITPAVFFLLVVASARAYGGQQVIQVDFRDSNSVNKSFQFEKEDHEDLCTPEATGLRITVPKGSTGSPVGLVLRKRLKGDFEIEVNYELLQSETQGDKWGSGFQFFLRLANQDGLVIARSNQGTAGHSLGFHHMTTGADGHRNVKQWTKGPVEAASQAGTIRVGRQQSLLTIAYTPKAGAALQTLGSFDVGTDDIIVCRLAANPQPNKFPVDVRILNCTIDANLIDPNPISPRKYLYLTIILMLIVGIMIGGYVYWRRRQRNDEPVAKTPAATARR